MQVVRREFLAILLQLPAGRADWPHANAHPSLFGCASALLHIARSASRDDVFPACLSAQSARGYMVKGKVPARAAILALKAVTQKHVEARKCRKFRLFYILAQRNHAGDFHVERWRVHFAVIAFDNIHPVKEHCFDRSLPRPQAERIIR